MKTVNNFIEKRFPEDISNGAKGGPKYNTNITISNSGFENRQIRWQQALNRYDVSHSIKTSEQMERLISFFHICKGKAFGFRFKDPIDNIAANEYIGTGDSKTLKWQLVKNYNYGTHNEVRIINKPVAGSQKIRINEQEISNYTLDSTTGTIYFENPPNMHDIIQADFNFDVPVRFDTDHLISTIESYGIYSWHEIPLIEIRI